MKHRGGAHEFALYAPNIDQQYYQKGKECVLTASELVHRISRVLRLNIDDTLLLFNTQHHLVGTITHITKHAVCLRVLDVFENTVFTPQITLLLPLLKREALEQAIYSAVELGVNHIQLIITEKVQRRWQAKELIRLEHVMIAAAEQSKYFSLPTLAQPVSLYDVPLSGKQLFLDCNGKMFADVIKDMQSSTMDACTVIIGPEGDLTEVEKFYLQQQKVEFVRLTGTILRAQQAVAVSIGLLRSFF